jgi:hypothetical protein
MRLGLKRGGKGDEPMRTIMSIERRQFAMTSLAPLLLPAGCWKVADLYAPRIAGNEQAAHDDDCLALVLAA